jgi:hypothetical protein
MKILFTGMASSHSKPSSNVTFFGNLAERVGSLADVEWKSPSVTWTKDDLEQYDAIFVGMLPLTSPSANKVYGAMNVINLMFDSPKLTLVLDHPQIWQYKHGFNAADRDVNNLFTNFFSKRPEFIIARDVHADSIVEANKKLLTKKWPRTLYPALPWGAGLKNVDKFISLFAEDSLIGINLDAWLLSNDSSDAPRRDHWVVDYPNTGWSKSLEKLLELPVVPLKEKSRVSDEDILNTIRQSSGLMLSPQERDSGTWWSYRLIQALNSSTPILTAWLESRSLGPEWSLLGSEWESLSMSDKLDVSKAQLESYRNAIPSKQDAEKSLASILKDSRKGEKNARG